MQREASLIFQRWDESQKYMRENYYDELTEVFRSLKCRTAPIYKKDSNGADTKDEDKGRTNVCMPDSNIVYRKNAARYTAQPYRLRYIGGSDPTIPEALSALAAQQYDRSNEAFHDRRIVMMAEGLGFAYGKLWWDHVVRMMQYRRLLMKGQMVNYRDRAQIMRAQGAPADEIKGAVIELGPEMSDAEVATAMAKTGKEIVTPQEVLKYEGPCMKSIFPGDLALPPGVLTLDDADWVIERFQESDTWLVKQTEELKYTDPETGEEVQAFDPKVVQELLDADPEPEDPNQRINDLKLMFEGAIGKTSTILPKHLRGRKKYDFYQQHEVDDDGRVWITWVAKRGASAPLGRMPYPWDLYGKWVYTELVPLPDMISAYGDSTPRLMRFLQQMHNRTVAQNFDYITNILKKIMLRDENCEIKSGVTDRGAWREIVVSKLGGIQELPEASAPPGMFERESQVLRMEALLEPALNTVDTGTASNPMAGKLATTALINQKAADSLTQFKIDARNLYLREIGYKKLWMNQQAATEQWKIERKFFGDELSKQVDGLNPQAEDYPDWALSDRNGKTVAICLDPYEIQEDYQVEPEAGSYLSVDDDIRSDAFQRVAQIALQAPPGIVDMRKLVRMGFATVRGVNPDDLMLPEPDTTQPPPVKGNLNISIPLDKMPADVVNQILPLVGLQPSQELAARDQAEGVVKLATAADAADRMTQPSGLPDGQNGTVAAGSGGSTKAAPRPNGAA